MIQAIIILLLQLFIAAPAETGELLIEVHGEQHVTGKVMMSLCSSNDDYMDDDAGLFYHFPMKNGKASFTIRGLVPDAYGIKMFVDTNGNDEMDFNVLGLPKEPYAFSNNAMGLISAPGFEAAKFHVHAGTKAVQKIKLRGD